MAIYKRGRFYWYEFLFAGRRIRESAKTTSRTLAREAERRRRRELEEALIGVPVENRRGRIRTVASAIEEYLDTYDCNHRSASVAFAHGRLKQVKGILGSTLITDLTEATIRRYMKARHEQGVCGRTINAEVGELSRAVGKLWSVLWPRVRKAEERKDVGKALTPEEERRLIEAAYQTRSPIAGTSVRMGLLTGMRPGEVTKGQWVQVDFERRVVTVGEAKSEAGTGRQIPMNGELYELLKAHAKWYTERFGEIRPEWYLFPFGKATNDPTRPTTTLKTAWNTIRGKAGVDCRLHDLRHTVATKLAEAGVPESTMLALLGHMSRSMLERYSHVRMTAKRQAVEALSTGQNSVSAPTKSPTVGLPIALQ